MATRFGGVGVALPLNQLGTNGVELQAGAVFLIPPGTFNLKHGGYLTLQTLDPVTNVWRPAGNDSGNWIQVDSDGNNYRIANQTGCPVAAMVTTAGTGYTSAPTVTAGAGSPKLQPIMGNYISSTITVVNGGSNYTYPPLVMIQAPPSPGWCATAYCTLSAGAVSTVTVTDEGGGYLTAPSISMVNDPREGVNGIAVGSGAICTTALGTGQTVVGVEVLDHGIPITGGTVPALTFTGGGGSSAAATLIMCWTVTSYAVTAGGAGYNGTVEVTTVGTGIPAASGSAYTNPQMQTSFLRTRPAIILGALSSNALTATGQTLVDGGILGNSGGSVLVIGATATTVATLTLGLAGANDFFWMQQG